MSMKHPLDWLLVLSLLVPAVVAAQSSDDGAKSVLWKQCDEDVLLVRVDPEPVARRLPENHSLALGEGKASLLIAVQDCPTYWIDGEDIGQTYEVHHWAAIDGKRDIRHVAGAERTLPTMTWFALFTGSSNPKSRASWTEAGTQSLAIKGLSMTAPDPEGGGQVALSEALGYSWKTQRGPPEFITVGVNHDVYTTNLNGDSVYNRIQCTAVIRAWSSKGSMQVTGNTEPSIAVRSGTYPVAVHTLSPLWCRGSLADKPPE